MADKSISELNQATTFYDNDLFVLSQGGVAKSLSGATLLGDLAARLDAHGGIKSITLLSTSGLNKTYRITYADYTYFDFIVKDGAKGDTAYWYVYIRYSDNQPTRDADMKTTPSNWMGVYSGNEETAPTSYTSYSWYRIKGTEGEGITSIVQNSDYSFTITMSDGSHYDTSPLKGATPVSITPPSTIVHGTTNTYTMTLSDSSTIQFPLYAGADGEGVGDMMSEVYDPDSVVAGAGGIEGYVEAYVPAHTTAALAGSATSISNLSVTYSTVAVYVSNGRLPFILINGTKAYVYAVDTGDVMYFVCPNRANGSFDWIGVDTENSITSGSVTYLTTASASSTYLTQSSASSTYLTQSSASSTYLTQSNASSTYLTQSSAASTYATSASVGAASGIATLNADSKVTATQSSAKYSSITADTELSNTHAGQTLLVNANATFTFGTLDDGSEIEIWNNGSYTVSISGTLFVAESGSKSSCNLASNSVCVLKKMNSTIYVAGNVTV